MRLLPTSFALVGLTLVVGAAGLAGCGSDSPSNTAGGGSGPSSNTAGSGTVSTAGKPNVPAGGSANGTGGSGVVGTGGSNTGAGGSNSGTAGNGVVGVGGSNTGTGGSGNPPGTGGSNPGTAGSASGGATNPNAPDQMGKTNAKPGDKTSTNLDYLKLGEIRILNNNWGSVFYKCTDKSPSSVFVNADKTFGWSFDRPDCDTGNNKDHPDFPSIEFGIHPFGLGSADATSPNFSSTTLLPKQVKDITELSVTLQNLSIKLDKAESWDLTFEFWLSKQNPATTQGNAGVYAELMTFWGWQPNRWPLTGMTGQNSPTCDTGSCDTGVQGGDKSYDLIVQRNSWGSGWKYYQFRSNDGSKQSFSGKVDVKKLLDYLVQKGGVTQDMWVARLEVGSEIDDNTKGSVSLSNVTFSVNGQTRSPVFGQ